MSPAPRILVSARNPVLVPKVTLKQGGSAPVTMAPMVTALVSTALSSVTGSKKAGLFGGRRRRRKRKTLSQGEKNDIMFLKANAGKTAVATYLAGR